MHTICARSPKPACGGRSRFCALSFRFTVAAKGKAEERPSAAEARVKAAERGLAAERSREEQQQRAAQLDKELHAATSSQQQVDCMASPCVLHRSASTPQFLRSSASTTQCLYGAVLLPFSLAASAHGPSAKALQPRPFSLAASAQGPSAQGPSA